MLVVERMTRPPIIVAGEATVQEALAIIQRTEPDVILMDIVMPGMDGLEATRRIAASQPGTRILVLTQYDDQHFVLPLLKAGAAGYVLYRHAPDETRLTQLVRIGEVTEYTDSPALDGTYRYAISSIRQAKKLPVSSPNPP